jgi:hypothetical protein
VGCVAVSCCQENRVERISQTKKCVVRRAAYREVNSHINNTKNHSTDTLRVYMYIISRTLRLISL